MRDTELLDFVEANRIGVTTDNDLTVPRWALTGPRHLIVEYFHAKPAFSTVFPTARAALLDFAEWYRGREGK